MKTLFFDTRCFVYCCVFTAGLLGLFARADSGGATQSRKLTLVELCERLDMGLKMAETNSDGKIDKHGLFGMAVQDVNSIGRLGDRAALPFLEEKSLMLNVPAFFRSCVAKNYVNLATAEECAAFLPKILKIGNETVWTASWRAGVVLACINKIEAAIAKNELPDETLNLLVAKLLAHTQSLSVPRRADGDMIDGFLNRHCDGYPTSKQRLVMWTNYLNELGKESWEEDLRKKFTPVKESVEAVPPRKRVDLRKRFPDLPPVPENRAAERPLKVALAIGAAFAALAVGAVAWFAVRRRKPHETG